MTSGGSMATLAALVAALDDKGQLDFRKRGLQSSTSPRILYTSSESHRSVEKDAAILGLGVDNVRRIAVDGAFRMRMDRLEDAVRADRRAGRVPFCVVATAGTVNTGAIDPLEELAGFCADEELWLHVDGAYGAFFILSETKRDALLGCGRADSLTLDPHKLLFAPIEAGCLVVRDRDKLKQAFGFTASYIPDGRDDLLVDFLDYGPQLSRGFKAFKVWCALRAFGTGAFEAAAEHVLEVARYMGERIAADPAFELLAPVALSAVCFRFRGADDARNRRILAELVEDGTALLGPVSIEGRFGMRACVTNFRTTRDDVDLVLRRLTQIRGLL
jgi:aromatic-L-amino-acid decarboxylase